MPNTPSLFQTPCRKWSFLHGLAAFLWLLTARPNAGGAPPAGTGNKPQFLVSAFNLGTVDQIPPTVESVLEGLNGSEWSSAAAQVSRQEWNEVPQGVDPAHWLSVVAVGFGKQAEAYVFQFNRADGGARLLAHYAHRKRLSQGSERWFQPTPQLLGVLQNHFARGGGPEGVPLQLEIVEATGAGAADSAGFEEALSLPPHVVLPPVKAIVTAAACSQGWAPTQKPAAARAKMEVRVLDRACSFRLTLEREGRQSIFTKERVPWEEFHEQLSVLFRWPGLSPAVVDFTRLNPREVELLDSDAARTFALIEGELAALDPNGQEVWRLRSIKGKTAVPLKKPDFFSVRREDSGKLRLFGWGASLVEISPADGKVTALAPEAPVGSAPTFDADSAGEVVVAREGRVAFFSAGKERWSTTETVPVQCGPRLEGDRVVFGNERGELVALARADGKPLWRVEAGGRLWGRIAAAGALRLAFSNEEETLLAFDPRDGKVQWRFAAGDALVQPPFVHENALVLATKNNRVVRLVPESGALQAEAKLGAWILGVRPFSAGKSGLLLVGDASGRLTALDAALKPVWEASSGARNTGAPVLAQLRPQWKQPPKKNPRGSSEEMLENLAAETDGLLPFLLCSDSKGFLYKISTRDLSK